MKLAQLSNINGSRGLTAAQTILTESPLLAYLDANSAFELDAIDFTWRPTSNTYDATTRAIGSTLTATDLAPEAKQSGSQTILAGALDMDIAYLRDIANGFDKLDVHLQKKLLRAWKGYALSVQNKLFNGTGTGTPTEIKGLKTILDGTTALPGYSGVTAVIDAATYGAASVKSLDVTSANASAAIQFNALMLSALNEVSNPTGIIMNNKLFSAISAFPEIARIIGETSTNYGTKLRTIYGLPIVIVDGTSIIATEPDNTATTPLTTTTSMYIMSPGETKTSLVTNSGLYYMEWDHQENKDASREKWEMSLAWKIEDTTSIRRVRNLKA